jgi:hypothetical protein
MAASSNLERLENLIKKGILDSNVSLEELEFYIKKNLGPSPLLLEDLFNLLEKGAITLTFGEQIENHIGMQKIGKIASEGFKSEDLKNIYAELIEKGVNAELIDLGKNIHPEAYVLIIRNGVSKIIKDHPGKLLLESMSIQHDKKYKDIRRKKVLNKNARWNLCFHDKSQKADYEEGKGTIISFEDLPFLSKMRKSLPILFGKKAEDLGCESNLYYCLKKCSINFHGDVERKIVIGVRLGNSFPLGFRWFLDSKPISEIYRIDLNHGDIYIMDDKAIGFDWRKRKIQTLRHAACEKGLKDVYKKS